MGSPRRHALPFATCIGTGHDPTASGVRTEGAVARGGPGRGVRAFLVPAQKRGGAEPPDRPRRVLRGQEGPRLFERVAAWPKTESGKIKRAELRAREIR